MSSVSARTLLLSLPLLGVLSACNDEAAELLLTCEGGNVEACYNDGVSYTDTTRPQYNNARKAFSTACMKDLHPKLRTENPERAAAQTLARAKSCYALGKLVADAKGGPKDPARAAELFEIACRPDINNPSGGPQVPDACVDLAYALYDGEGIREDAERAVELLGTSCNGTPPDLRACTLLGKAHAEGKGVKKADEAVALGLFTKTCEAKHADACVEGGNLVLAGKKAKELPDAAAFFEKGCDIDARKGCFELAQLHAEGKFPGASDQRASGYYQKTCNIDPTRGCFEAAKMMEEGKVEAGEGEIESLYNLACEHGHTEACSKRQIDLEDRDKTKGK
jgi:TPR repeat protein